ncbi:pur operon repressor [Pseudalkalibacillus caeni]|uniref:Pur operon repressor n=1 Tax=Exobacillus caeni TaxID=2574798 RepID=A0A5R9EVN3_9BACL|nr:pur operon repressor [Pseudalkalibacillus caeni]TLS35107.1 pur operon repressor [Pseudalkalibacillus caeni]
MKLKRSARLVDMTRFLLEHPHRLVPLTHFSDRYGSAKSSISEDLGIIKESFEQQGAGSLITVPGAAGGVKYIPLSNEEEAAQIIADLSERLSKPERILPGGYLYMTDILGNPELMNKIGRLFSSVFADRSIDVVMTVATKGIPLAYAVATYLNVPVVIVRRDSRVTEGSTVSINYISGSSKRIQTMALARRSLEAGSRVLVIDDFMKAGGTIQGMVSLLEEFQATVAGIGVLVEAQGDIEERLVEEFVSLMSLSQVDVKEKKVTVEPGNYRHKADKLLKGETE